ncbi:MAG: hypothetical protein AAGA31_21570, partial [Bacteroidota bacterium]
MEKLSCLILLFGLTSTLAAQKQVYSVGILTDVQTEKVTPLLAELQRKVTAVVGEDASIVFDPANILVNNLNLELAKQNYDQLLAGDPDIIL